MNAIQTFFVRSPRWQAFAFLVGSMCLAEVVVIATYPKGDTVTIPLFSLIATELWSICFLAWFWSLGSFLNSLVQPDLRPSMGFFRFSLIYPLAYLPVFYILFEKLTMGYGIAILPFHLLAMFCMFFNLNFVSKNLALAEIGRSVSFYDYAGPFFLLWFFPVGIWFVQPRVNHLYAKVVEPQTA